MAMAKGPAESEPGRIPPREVYDLNLNRPEPRITQVYHSVLPKPWSAFCADNKIEVIAVLGYENEVENQKIWPACGVLASGIERGDHVGKTAIIDSTSGNFGLALEWARAEIKRRWPEFPIERVIAVIPRSTPKEKRMLLEAAGIKLEDADSSLEAMARAAELARLHGYWYTRQYWNLDNTASWLTLAESIARRYRYLGAMACGVGSGGSCSGIMPVLTRCLRDRPTPTNLLRVAVVVEDGDAVDGVRTSAALKPGTLPWRSCIDDVRYVGIRRSLGVSRAIWRQADERPDTACLGGPSSGFALEGLMLALQRVAEMGKLDELRAGDEVRAAFLAPDTRKPYRSKYEDAGIYLPNNEWELPLRME